MSNQKFILPASILLGCIILGGFYWFELRPEQIRRGCWDRVQKMENGEIEIDTKVDEIEKYRIRMGVKESVDNLYNNCLRAKGVK